MSILYGMKFVDAQGVAVPDNGASIPGVEEVFQDAGNITGSLPENSPHAFLAFSGDEPLHVGLEARFIVAKHGVENNSCRESGPSSSLYSRA